MRTCFVISTIGQPDSLERKRSDALLNHVIRPVLEELGYDVTRADDFAAPQSINRGIIEHLENSDLVIADVHDLNPNVFYELGIRNVVNKPYILFKDEDKPLPFDIHAFSAISHPFPEFDCNNDEEMWQMYEKQIEKTRELLKKHVNDVPHHEVESSESSASQYLKMIHEKGNTKKLLKRRTWFTILSVAVVVVLLSFFAFSVIEYQKMTLDVQSRQIESDIYNNMNMVIFATLQFETQLKYMYDRGPSILNSSNTVTPTEFVEGIRTHGNLAGPFKELFQTTPISAYLYLHEHGDPCRFVAYAYLKDMERDGAIDGEEVKDIGRGLQSCDLMGDYGLIIADIHASTGTKDYSFPIVRNVDLKSNYGKDNDLVIATSVDLIEFSKAIRSNIYLDDVRFVLENRQSQIVFDCMKDGCPVNYKEIVNEQITNKEFDKHSKPLTYDLGDFTGYKNYKTIPLKNDHLTNDVKSSILLDGWQLHVLLPENSYMNLNRN